MKFNLRTARPISGTIPLMILHGGPFENLELSPHQAKFLAASLQGLADAVAEEDVTVPGWRPTSFTVFDCLGDKRPSVKGDPT